MSAIFLHGDGHEGYVGYSGPIVADVTFNDTRASARAILGMPSASREATNSSSLGIVGAWDEWVMPGNIFNAMYRYVVHVGYSLNDGPIEKIMITEAQVPATVSSPINSDSTAPAQLAKIETRSVNGSDIIEAWLDELEANQPEHGPLLQSTLDAVGYLPVVGDDGNLYAVSHSRYWVAVGYSQSYARGRAERRRIDSVLAEAQASKVGDALTMRQKEAEAQFWDSVQAWVNVNEPSSVTADGVPDWLARFSIG